MLDVMDLTPYIAQLREDLTTAASAGDEQTRHTTAMLGVALEPAARLAIMSALSELAAEVTATLDDRVVDVRLEGRDVRVVVSVQPKAETHDAPRGTGAAGPWAAEGTPADGQPPPFGPPPPPFEPGPPPFGDAGGDIRRMTLRLIDQVKTQAERAAAEQGVSLNTWVSQAVASALRGEPWHKPQWASGDRGGGNRIQGWVQG
jgi:hypothetical protein